MIDFPEDAIVILCAEASRDDGTFDDNVHGTCDSCKKQIVWRPHNPAGDDVYHICIQCMNQHLKELEVAGGELPVPQMSEQTKKEVFDNFGLIIQDKSN